MASAVVPENKKIHQANSVSVGLCCLLLLGTDFCNFATMRFSLKYLGLPLPNAKVVFSRE